MREAPCLSSHRQTQRLLSPVSSPLPHTIRPDGDGILSADAVPWDAFPHDSKEWRDTDGLGDNADTDDGDGYSDREERQAGTDPLGTVSFPEQ